MKMWTPLAAYPNTEIHELENQLDELTKSLASIIRFFDDDCWFNHNGNCQSHFLDGLGECRVAHARTLLKKIQESQSK